MNPVVYQTLVDYVEKDKQLELVGPIRSGKDSRVVLVKDETRDYALKIYKHLEKRVMTDNQQFLAGRYFRNPGIKKKVAKQNRLGKNILKKVWTKREFFLLEELYQAGLPIPKVYDWTSNSLLMEFIGENRKSALQLNEVIMTKTEAVEIKRQIMEAIEVMLTHKIVHGDLSQYNILVHNNQAFIIDFPQAIDIRTHDNWVSALEKDKKKY